MESLVSYWKGTGSKESKAGLREYFFERGILGFELGAWRLLLLEPRLQAGEVFFVFFLVLGFDVRAYTFSHSTCLFLCWVFFEIGSWELFAQGWL
jgi:hypothetical protein